MKTLIIDSNFLCYKAYFSMPKLSHNDANTHIVFSFFKQIIGLAKKFETNKFIFCWDSRVSFRKEIYPLYKYNRQEKTKEEKEKLATLFNQIDELKYSFLPSMGFVNLPEQIGMESDDLIAKITINDSHKEYIIVSSDKDLYQLIKSNVMMYNPSIKKLFTKTSFEKQFGIDPKLYVFVKIYAGCSTDKVPGISGIGDKTVIKYINNQLNRSSKAFLSISNMGYEFDRNKFLVKLPIRFTDSIKIKKDKLTKINVYNTLIKYDFKSFYLYPSSWNNIVRTLKLSN